MDFMGIGPLELLFILVIALIVFGPGRLPEVARGVGKGVRGLRKAWFEFTREVNKDIKDMENSSAKQGDEEGKESKGIG